MRRHLRLESLIRPVVEGLGYSFEGLQHLPQPKGRALLRLYIDKPGGVTVEDCVRVNRQVDAVMGVEGGIGRAYTLEVSSPGLDRLLFTPEQFKAYVGRTLSIRLSLALGGRRNFKGKLETVEEETISVSLEEQTFIFPFKEIAEARLVPEW